MLQEAYAHVRPHALIPDYPSLEAPYLTMDSSLQYLTDQDGSPQSVVIGIDDWNRLVARLETYHLVQNPTMHQRLLDAMGRGSGITFDESLRQIEYDSAGFEDLAWWNKYDHDLAVEIVQMLKEVQQDPFEGSGRPIALLDDLEGCWSRRLGGDHRLVYQILDTKIRVLACRYHDGTNGT